MKTNNHKKEKEKKDKKGLLGFDLKHFLCVKAAQQKDHCIIFFPKKRITRSILTCQSCTRLYEC